MADDNNKPNETSAEIEALKAANASLQETVTQLTESFATLQASIPEMLEVTTPPAPSEKTPEELEQERVLAADKKIREAWEN